MAGRENPGPAWQDGFRDVASARLLRLTELEATASAGWNFQPLAVPGLLQTEGYARLALRQLHADLTDAQVGSQVEIRMRRQHLLDRDDCPLLFFVLDEAVLRRLPGDSGLVRGQLARLAELAARPRITVEVVPFSAGCHPGMNGSFLIYDFPGTSNRVLYHEGPEAEPFSSDDLELVSRHEQIFEGLRQMSLGPEGSLAFIGELASRLA